MAKAYYNNIKIILKKMYEIIMFKEVISFYKLVKRKLNIYKKLKEKK